MFPQSYQWEDDQLVSDWLSVQLDPNNTANSMLLDNIQCLEREAAMARVRHTIQVRRSPTEFISFMRHVLSVRDKTTYAQR